MKILVATDGSRGGNAAVRFAARLAARDAAAELVLITIAGRAVVSRIALPRPQPPNDILAGASEILRSYGVTERCELLSLKTRREIPEAISTLADRIHADLVVIGSEGRDTLNEWVVGGVALRLIYVARRPVVVVRPTRRRKPSSAVREIRSSRHPRHELLIGNARPYLSKRRSRLRDRLV